MNRKQKEQFIELLNNMKNDTLEYLTTEDILSAVEKYLDDDKVKLHTNPEYTPEIGENLISYLKIKGIYAVLIGSLGRGQNSNSDIDIYIPNADITIKEKLLEIFYTSPTEPIGVVETDWGGLFFYNTEFGDIDVFFSIEEFNF